MANEPSEGEPTKSWAADPLERVQQLMADKIGSLLRAAAEPEDLSGSHVGPYQLLNKIGEGGFGVVFMAEQESPVRRRVALKIIKLGMDTRQVVARFEAERQALAMMDHPSVAKVFDGGATEAGRPYFVMELVNGTPITQYCDQNHLSIPQRLELFGQVCQAVQHAHQKGLIHRDIKPSNVLVSTQDDRPVAKVIDFGIAKAMQARLTEKTLFTDFRQMIGTPEYMSPEQAEGDLDIDTRTDVYSLGVLLYELLAGSPPFDPKELRSKAFAEMQRIICEVEPPAPSARLSTMKDMLPSVATQRGVAPRKLQTMVRGELDWIVMKCLEKDRARRYETPMELASDVRRHINLEPVLARPPSKIYRARKFVRRNRTWVIAVTAALVVGSAGTMWHLNRLTAERDRAEQALAYMLLDQGTTYCERSEVNSGLVCFAYALDYATRRGITDIEWACRSNLGLWARASQGLAHPIRDDKAINVLAFSHDGTRLLTASEDGESIVRSIRDGSVQLKLQHDFPVIAAVFAPKDRWIVTATLRRVHRWDATSGKSLHSPIPLDDGTTQVYLAPDAQTILAANADQTGRLWNLATSSPIGIPLLHEEWPISSAVFSDDSSTLLTGSGDKTARLWNAQDGTRIGLPLQHREPVTAVAMNASGNVALIGTGSGMFDSHGEARLWDLGRRESIGPYLEHNANICAAAISPDGTIAATASYDKTVRLWDVRTGTALGSPLIHRYIVRLIAFSPDGARILCAENGVAVQLWDVSSQRQLGPTFRTPGINKDIKFSDDGSMIGIASSLDDRTGDAALTGISLFNVASLKGPVEKMVLWTQVLSRREVDDRGRLHELNTRTWTALQRRLDRMGGAPELR